MKRIIALVLTILMICGSSTVMAGSDPTIDVSSATTKSGESVDVTISMKNNPGIITMRLYVNYDNSIMELTGFKDHSLIPGKVHTESELGIFPYCLYWDNGSASSNYTANGDLITLTFKLKENVEDGDYPIVVTYNNEEWDIFNYDFEPIEFKINNGNITVNNITKPQLDVTNITFVNDTTTFNLKLLSPDDLDGIVIVATYDENTNRLCNVRIIEDISANMEDVKIDNEGGTRLQVMWWDSLETLRPISEAYKTDLTK